MRTERQNKDLRQTDMTAEEYLKDPCRASSLSFWKTERMLLPAGAAVYREDEYAPGEHAGRDEPYFRMIHYLRDVPDAPLPGGYEMSSAGAEELAAHIRACYREESVTAGELEAYARRDVFDRDLWIAVREKGTGRIAASGIAELDARIGEGELDWIQVSPDHRRRGLGRAVVCELLRRLSQKAEFATVSGRLDSPDDPGSLYRSCGFERPVIWHVVT